MPFTFSHPAIVMPLLALPKKWRSATGLIIGSMAPDFEKFIRMSEFDPNSHTWRSIFYFNLPLGLILAFIFHMLVRDPLIVHLPKILRERFSRFIGFDWKAYFKKHYPIVIFSLLLGTVSHLVWDSFTHPEGRGVRYFPFLMQHAFGGLLKMRLYSFLQKLGSVLGALALVYYIQQMRREKIFLVKGNQVKYWALFTITTLGIIGIRLCLEDSVRLENLYHFAILLISGGMTSFILVPRMLKMWEAGKYESNV
ncbi:DUF4184 family protein [Hymenobacter wooponensis]|uniref:DUF4184 family protein n=1 Tax=Hymenobacter wooponensis TaxID=1525360 RepID=A0A4Z0MKU0_9BACT|nr:DUF4184 family protein [Hymenobacter wooponensis]TGD80383.1 DUF4184 family protein [Hymenobacter wooponensis]